MNPQNFTRMDLSRRLIRVARPVLFPLVFSLLARIVALVLGIALFAVGTWALGSYASDPASVTLSWVVWALVIMSLLKALFRYLEQYAGHYVAFRSLALLRNYFFDSLEPQAPAMTEGADTGDLLSRVTKDVDRVEVFFAHTLVPLATAVIVPIGTVVWMGVAISPLNALVLVPFLLIAGVFVPRFGGKATDQAARVLRATRGKLSHHVTDSVQGVREVIAFGGQERRITEMAQEMEEPIFQAQRKTSFWIAARRGWNQALLPLAVVAQLLVACSAYPSGALSIAQVTMSLGVALASFAPVLAVEDLTADLDQAYASAARIFAVTDREPLVPDPQIAHSIDGRGDLQISDVNFAYPKVNIASGLHDDMEEYEHLRPQVLHDVTVTIPAGSTTAIVGASGSGKSTLAALLARVWDPDSGSISIGGVDLREDTQDHIRSVVTLAPQRAHVFNDSIRANLLLARPDASDAELKDALEAVDLSEWIASESEGIDTKVGEMGERISGGQRQRLALARALLRETPIMILDEATSQVDRETEARVLAGIRRRTSDKTLIVVAHRLDTIRDADQIIVMDSGRIVEVGTWNQLYESGGALRALADREEGAR